MKVCSACGGRGVIQEKQRCVSCRKQFLPAKTGQKFCCELCRKVEHSKTPEFKASRRAYMRRYRKSTRVTQKVA